MANMDFESDAEDLHVLDLPQLYTRPTADVLLRTLDFLTSTPPSWQNSDIEDSEDNSSTLSPRKRIPKARKPFPQVKGSAEGLASYLTSIIASELRWIKDDDIREAIWEQASLRLSERSGRTGMPAMTRTFRIQTADCNIDLAIHEPALTADNLGLKTWASSYQLAKRLHQMCLPKVPESKGYHVLELGAGTGLVGLAAAAAMGWRVCLTDLPEIVPNLQRNAEANMEVIASRDGCACVGTLDWTAPAELDVRGIEGADESTPLPTSTARFPMILVADALYTSEHPKWLVQTIKRRLAESPDARVVAEMPQRPLFKSELEDFKTRMIDAGFQILEEGTETGKDDWGWSERGDVGEVTCWWSIWSRC